MIRSPRHIRIRTRYFPIFACLVFASFATLAGCKATTGGDTPVTHERLVGAVLIDIREPLSWSFTDATVLIEYGGEPIPSDVTEALLGDGVRPTHIEASWRLDEANGTVRLTSVTSRTESIDKEVAIPISPAGHVRLNLGSRQYNLFHQRANQP